MNKSILRYQFPPQSDIWSISQKEYDMIILKKYRLAILVNWIILLLTSFSFGAESISPHVTWKLEGANERIEKYRGIKGSRPYFVYST
jgi:hypothetical protein